MNARLTELIKSTFLLEKRAAPLFSRAFSGVKSLRPTNPLGSGITGTTRATAAPRSVLNTTRPPNPFVAGINTTAPASNPTPWSFGRLAKGLGKGAAPALAGGLMYGVPGLNTMADLSNGRVYAQGAATGVAETLKNIPFGLGEKALQWKLNSTKGSLFDGVGLTQRRVMQDALHRMRMQTPATELNPYLDELNAMTNSDWAQSGLQQTAAKSKALALAIAQQKQQANITPELQKILARYAP